MLVDTLINDDCLTVRSYMSAPYKMSKGRVGTKVIATCVFYEKIIGRSRNPFERAAISQTLYTLKQLYKGQMPKGAIRFSSKIGPNETDPTYFHMYFKDMNSFLHFKLLIG